MILLQEVLKLRLQAIIFFMIKNINDVSEHGNIGLFSIASYDSQFTLKHYYNVPLLPFNLPLGEHGKWVSQKWEEFCELNKIKKV
jgi:hypothetical protein